MKKCLGCFATFNTNDWTCPSCDHNNAQLVGSLPLFAPQLAEENDGFKKENFDRLIKLEEGNFWFEARNQIILNSLKELHPTEANYMEIGCGTGFVLRGVCNSTLPYRVTGTEIFANALDMVQTRVGTQAELMQLDARHIPFEEEFDIIGAYDCIEHISEDRDVLAQIYTALKPGGLIAITVPQHPFLWSQADERADHKRRYTAKELQDKFEAANFKVIKSSSFTSFLLPLMYLSRLLNKNKNAKVNTKHTDGLHLPGFVNQTFLALMKIEAKLISKGINLPCGGSRLMIGQKLAKKKPITTCFI